jgi:hypothetical protein
VIKNEWLTEAAPKGKSYASCADTKYNEDMIPHIKDADLIYHETTYLENFRDRAELRFHSTTKQAAMMAQKAGSKRSDCITMDKMYLYMPGCLNSSRNQLHHEAGEAKKKNDMLFR